MNLTEDTGKRFHNPLVKTGEEAKVLKNKDAIAIIKNAEILKERVLTKVVKSVGFLTLGTKDFNFVQGEFNSGFLGTDGVSFIYDPIALIHTLKPENSEFSELCYTCLHYLHSLWHCLLGHVEVSDRIYGKCVSQRFLQLLSDLDCVENATVQVTYDDLNNKGKRIVFQVWSLACDICVSAILVDHVVKIDELSSKRFQSSVNRGLLAPASTSTRGLSIEEGRRTLANYKQYVSNIDKLRTDLSKIMTEIQNSRGVGASNAKALNVFEPIKIFTFLNEKIQMGGLSALRNYYEFIMDSHDLWPTAEKFADYDNESESESESDGNVSNSNNSSFSGTSSKGSTKGNKSGGGNSDSSQEGDDTSGLEGDGNSDSSQEGAGAGGSSGGGSSSGSRNSKDSKGDNTNKTFEFGQGSSDSSNSMGTDAGSSYQTGFQSKSEIQKQTSNIYSEKKIDWKTSLKLIKSQMENTYRDFWQNSDNVKDTLNYLYKERYDFSTWLRKFCHFVNVPKEDEESLEYGIYDYGCRTFGDKLLIEYPESKPEFKIEDFVIVLDTSGSCSGETIKKFVNKVYSILMESKSFATRMHVHIIQCDAEVQEYVVLKNAREVESYLRTMTVKGLGGTDFRPAFDFIESRIKSGEIKKLDGILYFTDGFGTMPTHSIGAKTAFVYLYADRNHPETPQWIDDYILEEKDLDIESM